MVFDFTKINIEKFQTEDACLSFISGQKWADGYTCRKCGHTNYCKGNLPIRAGVHVASMKNLLLRTPSFTVAIFPSLKPFGSPILFVMTPVFPPMSYPGNWNDGR